MFAVCAGMFRSGSTVQYQIVSHLVERYLGGKRLGFVDWGVLDEFRQEAIDRQWRVLKVHAPNDSRIALIPTPGSICFYTYRDIRDVIYSLMHMHNTSFETVVPSLLSQILASDKYWRSHPTTLVQRYEDTVLETRRMTSEIADFLGIALRTSEVERIGQTYSLSENRRRVRQLNTTLGEPGCDHTPTSRGEKDDFSQLHGNHIRDGRAGTWRHEANEEEVGQMRQLCSDWLIANGYERDRQW